jgi:hypothetical protein
LAVEVVESGLATTDPGGAPAAVCSVVTLGDPCAYVVAVSSDNVGAEPVTVTVIVNAGDPAANITFVDAADMTAGDLVTAPVPAPDAVIVVESGQATGSPVDLPFTLYRLT